MVLRRSAIRVARRATCKDADSSRCPSTRQCGTTSYPRHLRIALKARCEKCNVSRWETSVSQSSTWPFSLKRCMAWLNQSTFARTSLFITLLISIACPSINSIERTVPIWWKKPSWNKVCRIRSRERMFGVMISWLSSSMALVPIIEIGNALQTWCRIQQVANFLPVRRIVQYGRRVTYPQEQCVMMVFSVKLEVYPSKSQR